MLPQRLALQVAYHLANHFPGGVWLVELAGIEPASVSTPPSVLHA